MRRRFFLIFNTKAGLARSRTVDAVVDALTRAGAVVTHSKATSAGEARQEAAHAARSGDYDAILAAGGDGTVRQAAAAAAGTTCPIAPIMLGTGNVLAHELGLPRRPGPLARMILSGPEIEIEMGLANGEPFLLMAGVGFDGRVIAALDHGLKQRLWKLAYVPPVLRALAAPPDRLTVTCDGNRRDAAWAVVSNARRYGGQFVLAPATSIRQPGLQAILFDGPGRAQRLSQLLSLGLGRLGARAAKPTSDVTMSACCDVAIDAPHPVPVQIDGDDFGTTPLRVTTGGGRVSLIVARV